MDPSDSSLNTMSLLYPHNIYQIIRALEYPVLEEFHLARQLKSACMLLLSNQSHYTYAIPINIPSGPSTCTACMHSNTTIDYLYS